ncbi:class I SAM-dependent DNA methyltransferase [Brucella melitensis]|uniref:class I SAM-dependent DNA methyltransferase n=1 Tax=Brucella melitensis TaxID=29459 RepID=UPI0001B592BA|nr:class I SAM-dependent methyltransferase [Brucella melitensis]AIJ86111.1 methyltransferase domain protein [Brucella melitensis bv. 3 str. Ether]AOG49790.1 S-adenosylmethionine-dependent methyltransferase [Brucella melitensis]ARY24633.1 S-adenosylmethionine-dependent methyltransferase [Brucella melitensis]ARY27808.1 S-adenosylmethionine-dependent methyltransferase [Brucella melitensis]ARY37288.1 S-adenosylmethionine-dependent methyltransferase [Brucella melitensis]
MAQSDDKPLDQETLAEAYNRALALEKAGDFDAAAKAYEEVLQIDPDDHGGAAVRLASMGRGAVPLKAPEAYVATLFDQHAEMFDTILVDQLGYDVPLQLREMLLEMDDAFNAERMLDLGCGTGLSADALDDMAAHKTGVDISENMIEVAYEKGDYDALFVGEAVRFLESTEEENWDLIVATDVLPYMGELERFFAGVAEHLNSGGHFGFSSETLDDNRLAGRAFVVGDYQRFAHAQSYVRAMLDSHGMDCIRCEDITVRSEQGAPVPGHLYIARRR